jgi:hypothetical protein
VSTSRPTLRLRAAGAAFAARAALAVQRSASAASIASSGRGAAFKYVIG